MKNGDNAFAAYRRIVDYWIVFIHVVRGRPGGLLQFSKWEAVKIFLASVSSIAFVQCGRTGRNAVLEQ